MENEHMYQTFLVEELEQLKEFMHTRSEVPTITFGDKIKDWPRADVLDLLERFSLRKDPGAVFDDKEAGARTMTDSELDLDELERVANAAHRIPGIWPKSDALYRYRVEFCPKTTIAMIARIRELETGKEMCELFHSAEPPVTDEELREELTNLTVENMTCSFCSEMKPDETQVICNECNIDAVDQLAALEKKVSELKTKLAESEKRAEAWKLAALETEKARDPDNDLDYVEWLDANINCDALQEAARELEEAGR